MTGALADELSDRGLEILRRTGFRKDGVAPGAPCALRIGRKRGIAGYGNHRHVACPGVVSEPAGQLEPVDSRNVEVGHDHVRDGIPCAFERLKAVVGLLDPEARLRQPICIHATTVPVILDKEHDWRRFPVLHLGHRGKV